MSQLIDPRTIEVCGIKPSDLSPTGYVAIIKRTSPEGKVYYTCTPYGSQTAPLAHEPKL